MLPFLFRAKVCVLSVLFHLSSIHVASSASCGCSSLVIPVHVDVLIPKDPADVFAGLKSNASSLRRLQETYDVYGVFCQPDTVTPKNAGQLQSGFVRFSSNTFPDVIQLLVHGFTYTSQYWSPPVEEFRNYSYVAFSCDRGLSSPSIGWASG
jgi:hypothetical protein